MVGWALLAYSAVGRRDIVCLAAARILRSWALELRTSNGHFHLRLAAEVSGVLGAIPGSGRSLCD